MKTGQRNLNRGMQGLKCKIEKDMPEKWDINGIRCEGVAYTYWDPEIWTHLRIFVYLFSHLKLKVSGKASESAVINNSTTEISNK